MSDVPAHHFGHGVRGARAARAAFHRRRRAPGIKATGSHSPARSVCSNVKVTTTPVQGLKKMNSRCLLVLAAALGVGTYNSMWRCERCHCRRYFLLTCDHVVIASECGSGTD